MADKEIRFCRTGLGRHKSLGDARIDLQHLAQRLCGVEEGRKLYKVLLEKIRLAKEARDKAQQWYDDHISTCVECGREEA